MDEIKRVTIENYPVERLPEEIRDQFADEREVVLRIESRQREAQGRKISEILEAMRGERMLNEDPVVRVRALRAEWDHRDELIARIRSGETI